MMGAAVYYGKSRGGSFGQAVFRQIGGWMLGIFLFGFAVPGINNWGHGGGFAAGLLLGRLLGYRERKAEGSFDRMAAGICAAGTLLTLGYALVTSFLYRFF
jgi:rhomboid protease GluP